MLKFCTLYAHGSAYYSSMPAYYSNFLSHYAHVESMIKTVMIIVLNHNRGLYVVSQRLFLPTVKKEFHKTPLDAADNG